MIPVKRIRTATAEDAPALTALALRAKAFWGYDDDFMSRCHDELRITPEKIFDSCRDYFLIGNENRAFGFYGLNHQSIDECELEALFVEPEFIGRGFGKSLLLHAKESARARGYTKISIQSDPNALDFYQNMGARQVSTCPSESIPGRMLPLLVIAV